MHDWTLLSLEFYWLTGTLVFRLQSPDGPRNLTASGVSELTIPRKLPWGQSASINTVTGPIMSTDGTSKLAVEMQSGDTLQIIAKSFGLSLAT